MKLKFLFLDGQVSVSSEVEDSVSVEVRTGQLHIGFSWYSTIECFNWESWGRRVPNA
jgi:hypothetical protein